MNSQLIVTILGADNSGILSEIASTVSEANCSILDSRQAIYGRDFSLTMIIEGAYPDIARVECMIPLVCQRLDLLSMMKRTSEHEKQNLERLFDVEFSGDDTPGLVKDVSSIFAQRNASISAFRQKTFSGLATGHPQIRCKFVISISHDSDTQELETAVNDCFSRLKLKGTFNDKGIKEQNEKATSW